MANKDVKDTLSLVHILCPICHYPKDQEMVVVEAVSQNELEAHKKNKYQSYDIDSEPCENCQEFIDQGQVFVAELDIREFTSNPKLTNPKHTGRAVWLDKKKFEDVIGDSIPDDTGFLFVDVGQLEALGFSEEEITDITDKKE